MSDANCLLAESRESLEEDLVAHFAALPEGTRVEEVEGIATVTLPTGEVIREGEYVNEFSAGGAETSSRTDLSPACEAESDKYPEVLHVGSAEINLITDDPAEFGWDEEPGSSA